MNVRIINVDFTNVPGNVSAVNTFLRDKGFNLTTVQEHSATFVRRDLMEEVMGTTKRPRAPRASRRKEKRVVSFEIKHDT